MKYIELKDLEALKLKPILDQIQSDDLSIIENLELMAIDEVSAYIGGDYDVTYIFGETSTRSPMLKRIISDIVIYLSFQRVSGNNIPQYIIDTYDKDIEFLKGVAKGIYAMNIMKKDPTVQPTSGIIFGSETKMVNNNIN